MVVLGLAVAAVLRRRGWSTPGRAIGSAVVPVTTFLALHNPLHDRLPLFAYGPSDRWETAGWLWSALLMVAAVTLIASGIERRSRHRLRKGHISPATFNL
jgi:hypothetical protein